MTGLQGVTAMDDIRKNAEKKLPTRVRHMLNRIEHSLNTRIIVSKECFFT